MLAHSVTETNNSLKTDKCMTAILHSVHLVSDLFSALGNPSFFFHLVINVVVFYLL